MVDGVFYDGLQGQLRQVIGQDVGVLLFVVLDREAQLFPEAVPLDDVVVADVRKFGPHRDQIVGAGDGVPEKPRQRLRHPRHIVQPGVEGLPPDSLERVVQKMRIDLVLERQILRLLSRGADQLVVADDVLHLADGLLNHGVERGRHFKQAVDRVPRNEKLQGPGAFEIRAVNPPAPHEGKPRDGGGFGRQQKIMLPFPERERRADAEKDNGGGQSGGGRQTDAGRQVSEFLSFHCAPPS